MYKHNFYNGELILDYETDKKETIECINHINTNFDYKEINNLNILRLVRHELENKDQKSIMKNKVTLLYSDGILEYKESDVFSSYRLFIDCFYLLYKNMWFNIYGTNKYVCNHTFFNLIMRVFDASYNTKKHNYERHLVRGFCNIIDYINNPYIYLLNQSNSYNDIIKCIHQFS